MGKKLTNEDFISKAKKYHGNKYDYSFVNYYKRDINIKIICPIHGIFEQTPNNHLNGRGCQKCGIESLIKSKLRLQNDVISNFIKIHGDKYDYSDSIYERMSKKINIKCKKCNYIFQQTPNNHISKKQGCPKCSGNLRITVGEFLNRSRKIHNNFYEYYIDNNIENNFSKLKIKCPNHGFFKQSVAKHLQGQGCPKCVNKVSKAEQELYEFIKTFKEDTEQSNRKLIKPYELDIYIPSLNLAFEYNGEYWHSEKFKDKDHRQYKTDLCVLKNIKLIHIEEKDWKKDKEQIKNRIKKLIIK